MSRPLSILLLADDQKGHPNTIHDHINTFGRYSRHRVELFNPRGLARSRFLDLDQFDVVVIHYSIVVIWDDYLAPSFREQIRRFSGLKVQFLQDEYRWVDDVTATMRELEIDVLFSCVRPDSIASVYGDRLPETEILPTLTGYVPAALVDRSVLPLRDRRIDVGYRGRSVPAWLGRLGHEKIEIGRRFLELAATTNLRSDIAWTEHARFHGERWNAFIASCRSMLGSESGSSVVDYEGAAERAVRDYLAAKPRATYEEIESEVLQPFVGGPSIYTVSPRVFEAAAHRTAMVMFPGEYANVVQPWEHYIPLEKDFSNFDEVVERIGDVAFLAEMTERAYAHVIASGRYSEKAFIRSFDAIVEERAHARSRGGTYPRGRLKLEQLAAGRTYHVSSLYDLARELVLGYLGMRESVRHRGLWPFALRARRWRSVQPGATGLWSDLFRLGILAAVRRGRVFYPGEAFDVEAHYDSSARRLTLTSRRRDERNEPAALTNGCRDEVVAAIQAGEMAEILWNHATIGAYVAMRIPALGRRISFDVGRYDAYGVYRFEQLVRVAHTSPELVIGALEPLLPSSPPRKVHPCASADRPPTNVDPTKRRGNE